MLEYLRTCSFLKNVAVNAVKAFKQVKGYHWPDVWQKCEEFGIDNLDFSDTPMHLLYLGINKYILSTMQKLLKQRLRQNQHFGRSASKSLELCRENDLDCCNANKFTNKHGSVITKSWESSHYQVFTRVSFSVYGHFDSILNDDQLKCNSYKSFKQFSALWYCLISRMFSK